MLLFLFFAYCLRSGGRDFLSLIVVLSFLRECFLCFVFQNWRLGFCDYGLFVCLMEIFMGFGGLFAGFLFLLLSGESGMTCVEHNREEAEYEKFCSH